MVTSGEAWSSHGGPPFGIAGGGTRPEPEAVVSGLQDVAMMRQAVEQRRGHLGVAEHARPLAEAKVGADDDAGAFVKLAHLAIKLSPRIPARSSACGSQRGTTRCSASRSRWCGASGTWANPPS